jgi:enoyl-CoA hydratase/carnithine racemase
MPTELRTERHEATLLLTISDPPSCNALSDQVYAAGVEALNVAESDADIRCVVLHGEGANFCAGGDVKQVAARRAQDTDVSRQTIERFHHFIEALRVFPKPVIACVEGAAASGGFSLALTCDLIVAAEDARFIMGYGRLGLSPDGGGAWHLAQALPRQLVMRMLWLAEAMSARELQAFGVVNWVTDSGKALSHALDIASRLAQTTAGNALTSAKELVQQAPRRSLTEHLAAEQDHFIDSLMHPNAGEGLAAFLEKRAPRFR